MQAGGEIPRRRTQLPFRSCDPLMPRHRPSHRLLAAPSCSCATREREKQRRGPPSYQGFTKGMGSTGVRGQCFVLGRVPRDIGFEGALQVRNEEGKSDRQEDRDEGTDQVEPKPPHPSRRRRWREGEEKRKHVALNPSPRPHPASSVCGPKHQPRPPNDRRLPADVLAPCTPCASSSSSVFGGGPAVLTSGPAAVVGSPIHL